VFFHPEERGLPCVNRVAFRAFTFFRTIGELAFVWVGLVAIDAICEGYRLLEVAIYVAGSAGHLRVFAELGELRFRMVESEAR